ncbi:MAG: heparinase II/III family protein, partial [Akkermansiaceae bacterium]|nr:heparinase II/III family protein [Armatimonadota bacterium]
MQNLLSCVATGTFLILLPSPLIAADVNHSESENPDGMTQTPASSPAALPLTDANWKRLPPHPRLFADPARITAVKSRKDEISQQLLALLQNDAESKLVSEPLVYPPTGFLLDPVRKVQGRILTLALAYRLTGDKRYFERARKELLQLADLPEWRPSHFLDVGEAALAAGVGLDWLYGDLTPEERERIANAIVKNALLPSLDVKEGTNSWVDGDFNWNQVCHGGLVVGALAVAEREPELARRVVDRAVRNLPKAGAAYAPDGSYPEGPSYWAYGTTFHVILVEALRSVLGTAGGLDRMPGFLQTTDFMEQMKAPTGQDYNFSDYHKRGKSEPILLWFAKERGRRETAREELENLAAAHRTILDAPAGERRDIPLSRHFALEVLWWNPELPPMRAATALPLHWTASGSLPIAVLRSAWGDPNATYLAIKGGTPNQSHGHMDVGSFVLEAGGVRWALDLGTESYDKMRAAKLNLWNYSQNSSRWTTFRVGPEGHNLLRFDGALQDITGKAEIRALPVTNGVVGDVVDLTPLYRGQVAKAERTVRMYPDRSVSITDEWTTGDRPVRASFQWLTTATVTRTSDGVRLEQAGR